jgi:hypothetical protein
MVLQVEITTFIYWPIECTPRAWFEWVFQLERSNLKELPSSTGQLNTLKFFIYKISST